MMKQAIIIFSRIPVPGQTKTRLMPYLSGEECAKLHQSLITNTCNEAKKCGGDVIVSYTPEASEETKLRVFGRRVTQFYIQEGEDLGERMQNAFEKAFSAGYEKVLLVGTDIPELSKSIFEDAFLSLDQNDVVLHPTSDGGYYLIGMKRPHKEIWNVKHYGTNTVWEDTLKCISESGLKTGIGKTLLDIDTKEDYEKWKGLATADCIECNVCMESCLFLKKYQITSAMLAERKDLAYACFLCGACKSTCPVGIDGSALAEKNRRELVINQGEKLLDKSYQSLLWEKNPYKFANYKKAKKKSVLFPGCNFPSFYPKTMKQLEKIMSEHEIGIAYDCCGKPVAELGLQKDQERNLQELEEKLCRQGVEELVVLCPNCYYFMKDKIGIPMVTIYHKLAELGEGKKLTFDKMPMYYPCPDREKKEFIQDIQKFVDGEIYNEYSDVQCCGLGGCAGVKEPELVGDMVRLAKAHEKELYTYCASCISNFKRRGMEEVTHVLPEILGIKENMPNGVKPFLNRAIKKLS